MESPHHRPARVTVRIGPTEAPWSRLWDWLLGPPGEDAREDAIRPFEKQGPSEPRTDGEQDSETDE